MQWNWAALAVWLVRGVLGLACFLGGTAYGVLLERAERRERDRAEEQGPLLRLVADRERA